MESVGRAGRWVLVAPLRAARTLLRDACCGRELLPQGIVGGALGGGNRYRRRSLGGADEAFELDADVVLGVEP